jgi:hypothetical protein
MRSAEAGAAGGPPVTPPPLAAVRTGSASVSLPPRLRVQTFRSASGRRTTSGHRLSSQMSLIYTHACGTWRGVGPRTRPAPPASDSRTTGERARAIDDRCCFTCAFVCVSAGGRSPGTRAASPPRSSRGTAPASTGGKACSRDIFRVSPQNLQGRRARLEAALADGFTSTRRPSRIHRPLAAPGAVCLAPHPVSGRRAHRRR